jgi:hypothetical protein
VSPPPPFPPDLAAKVREMAAKIADVEARLIELEKGLHEVTAAGGKLARLRHDLNNYRMAINQLSTEVDERVPLPPAPSPTLKRRP